MQCTRQSSIQLSQLVGLQVVQAYGTLEYLKNLQNPSPWNTTSRIGSVKNLLHNTFPTGRSHPLNLVRICQGDTTHLACPNNEVLSISDAMYGRTVSGTVSHIRRYKSHTQIQVTYADTRIERYTLSQCLFDVL